MSRSRTFTVEEANGLLPDLIPLLESLRDAHEAMSAHREEVQTSAQTNGGGPAHRAFAEASARAAGALGRIEELGVMVREPATGLVDFLGVRRGEEIYLCWRLGEPAVAWWHPLEGGFAARQPL